MLARALQVSFRLMDQALENSLCAFAQGSLPSGVVVVDARCKVLFANQRALAAMRDKHAFSDRNGRLSVVPSGEAAKFNAFVRTAASGTGACGDAFRLAVGGAAYSVIVCPITGELRATAGTAALVLIVDLRVQSDPGGQDHLRAIFGLTKAEAQLARALMDEQSLTEAGEARGISYQTARCGLKSVFQKVGVNQQSQLVARLTRVVRDMPMRSEQK